MTKQIVRIVIWGLVAVAVVVVAYINYAAGKVSGKIDEANAQIDEGRATSKELGSEADQFLSGALPKALTSDRAKLEAWVAKTNGLLAKVVEDYRAAAAKFEEGRKFALGGVVSKYVELKSHAYQKLADAEEARRKAVVLFIDKSIDSKDELRKKQTVLISEFFKLNSEFDRLDEEAEQLHEENKRKFK